MSVPNTTTNYYGQLTVGQYIFFQALFLPIGFVGIFGNGLILITYFKYKQVRDAECAHLIAGLAFGDFICGVGAVIVGSARLEIPFFNDFTFTRFSCIFTSVPNQFGIEMSQTMTMAIAFDRLLAVSNPFAYRARNHRLYACVSVLLSVLCGCFIVILSTAGVDFSKQPSRCSWTSSVTLLSGNIFTIANVFVGPIVAVIYATVIYKQRKFLYSQHQPSTHGRTDASSKKFLTTQAKITVMLTKLVVIYCILVAAPLAILELWTVLNISPLFTSTFLSPLRNVTISLNSAVNVIVYAQSSSTLHPYLLHLLTCGRKGYATSATAFKQAANTAIISRQTSVPQSIRTGKSVITTSSVKGNAIGVTLPTQLPHID